MNGPIPVRELPYEARERIADNVFLLRRRAGYSQEALGKLAMVSPDRIGRIENGRVVGKFGSYVRLAGSLSVRVHDLLAGVTWTPASIELEVDAAYEVELGDPDDSEPAIA
jgi:transcriptional regulator with XRE-family HTH domain